MATYLRHVSGFRMVLASGLCAALLLSIGCSGDDPTGDPSAATSGGGQPDRDHLSLAWEFLAQRDEIDPERAARQILYHLNRWIQDQPKDPDWELDSLIARLPRAMRADNTITQLLGDLDRYRFDGSDVMVLGDYRDMMYLEECKWLYEISEIVRRQPTRPELAAWLASQDSLDEDQQKQLALADRLFDWVVRNIQLDETLPYPRAGGAGPLPGAGAAAAAFPSMRMEPGPGYQFYPWHVLMYGRGDIEQRARVFLLLAQQQHLDVTMLGMDRGGSPRPDPWLPAVLIGDQLYLFDIQLGLPLPGPGGAGIATLDQLRADPEMLASLSLGDNYKYSIETADLDRVVAMIDASPETLSLRMKMLQRGLSRTTQMVLSNSPSKLADKLRECPAVTSVRLSILPFETYLFRRRFGELLQVDQRIAAQHFMRTGVFFGNYPLPQARRRHLNGQLETIDNKEGAKALYMSVRMPDSILQDILSSSEIRRQMGLEKMRGEQDDAYRARVTREYAMRVQAKEHASYWLGLAHFDSGAPQVALPWFKKRTLEATPNGPWTSSARYNLARCYEAAGQLEEARKLYNEDDSPQRHGNLLRARSLKALDEGS